MPLIITLIVGLIFMDGTPYLFEGQEEVFSWVFYVSAAIVALHVLIVLIFGGIMAAVWRR